MLDMPAMALPEREVSVPVPPVSFCTYLYSVSTNSRPVTCARRSTKGGVYAQ